jgi:hypothetical protein
MDRFCKLAGVLVVLALLVGPVFAQQQAGQNQAGQVQAGQGLASQGTQGPLHGGIPQTPWFSDQGIRNQLKFNNDQFDRLNKAYGESWNRYRNDIGQFGTLSEADRAKKMQEMNQNFYKGFMSSSSDILNPEQRDRFNQLYLQSQGYNAFSDPQVQQKLNLTPEQQQKIQQWSTDYNTQYQNLNKSYATDREGTTKRFNEFRQKNREQINSLLNEQQRQTWREMTGEAYDFQPSFGQLGQQGQSGNNNNKNNPNP